MKEKLWDAPNKMHFESDFSTFNRQVDLITTGNVLGNVQTSFYIRPYSEVKNGSFTAEPGRFLRFDMNMFEDAGMHIPRSIREKLEDKTRKQSYILYNFHYWKGSEKVQIGWVLTDSDYKLIEKVPVLQYGTSHYKRISALNECAEYVCA